jgi:taurine dioxygenase
MTTKNFGPLICKPLTVNIGARISGIDLTAEQLPENTLQFIHDALMEYKVLFFRNQDIAPARHKEIASFFGESLIHPAYSHVPYYPEISILESTPDRPTKIELWHTDMTFSMTPPLGSFLKGVDVPDVGGDTMWGSTAAAYNALSDVMKEKIDNLYAVHSFEFGFKESIAEKGREAFQSAIDANPPIEHPMVRTHPVTKEKGLFVNSLFTTHIVGMEKSESEFLLGYLYQHMIKAEFTVRFKWEKNSFVIWDNRASIHKPVNDYFPKYRQLQRITIKGDRPY